MGKSVLLVGTLDTKGLEFQFVRGQLAERGMSTVVVDVGVGSAPAFRAGCDARPGGAGGR